MLKNKLENRITYRKSYEKKWLYSGFFIIFLLMSGLFISPMTSNVELQFHSSQLRKVVTKEGNIERTDFVDSAGKSTIAAELRYATSIVTAKGNSKLEQYYDDKGQPACRYNGYYGVLQEYDDEGNNICTTYLNANGAPMIMANGFAKEIREYNDNGQIITVRYYDAEGKPIQTPLYGQGKKNEYDENGKVVKITYVDTSSMPILTGQGYASLTRSYYNKSDGSQNGRVENEFYYDEEGNPISRSLGQYGVHKEYNEYGWESAITYLDAVGKPIVTNKGYTTITRTYHEDGTIETERYYDLDGNPFPLSEGQYGVEINNNQIVYLDRNGRETFNLRNILYNHSWVIIPLVMISIFLSSIVGKKWNVLFLIMYLCVIGYMTLMFRENSDIKGLGLFLSYGKVFTDSTARADILKNIWLFIPLGSILYQLYPKKVMLLIPIILSVLIESIQYFFGLGFCELDDVISNSLGGWIGFSAGKLTTDLKLRIKKWYCKI